MSEVFTPVTADILPENASTLAVLRAVIRNPIEIWSDYYYRNHTASMTFLGQRVHTTTDPEIAKAVLLTQFEHFPKSDLEQIVLERATGRGLLTAQGAEWRTQRKVSSPVFRHRHLLGVAPVMIEAGHAAGQRLAQREGEVDLLPVLANATLKVIGSTLLSGDEEDIDFKAMAHHVDLLLEHLGKVDILDFFRPTRHLSRPWGKPGRTAVRWMQDTAARVIGGRRLSGKQATDLLGLLMSAVDPDTQTGLSDDRIRDNVVTFIGAGHETTSLALAWSLYLLANHPEWQDRLAAERTRVLRGDALQPDMIEQLKEHEMVVQEAMRLYPPAPSLDRSAATDMQIGDLEVRKDDVVVVATYPMHRHRKLWEAANQFDPLRFTAQRSADRHRFQYIPFSAGPRVCIGWKFAMMEAVAILAGVLDQITVAPAAAFRPYPRARITLRPVGGMRLHVTARR